MNKKFKVQIRTKNYSSAPLRGAIFSDQRVIVRLGSTTTITSAFPKGVQLGRPIKEINKVEAVENSRSKLRMKSCFAQHDLPQSVWWDSIDDLMTETNPIPYPIVAKRIFGFKGHGMLLINNKEELDNFIKNTNTSGYYFEEFKNYAREYRLHCTKTECFMSWRKLRKSDAKERWFFNSSNCNWISPEHELFNRPNNWANIERDCIQAMIAVGLDIGAVDVRVQSKDNPEYIILEVNSAPALGEQGIEIYKNEIIKLIENYA